LRLFGDLPSLKALVPGNHDLWVADNDGRGDSLAVYQSYLPRLCQEHGYHYLDQEPLILPQADLAIVGSINWYDYSWSIDRMAAEVPNWKWHLENKAFSRGRHYDGRFVQWRTDDVEFTRKIVAELSRQLTHALEQSAHAIVMTHHPAFHALSFPRPAPAQGLDELLWEALSGNRAVESLLKNHSDRIPLILSGHTHRAAEAQLGATRGINIGGDYHFKRMLVYDWPARTIESFVFGDPGRRR
jgi:predicted phosphohydrolase